ncbi:hypothetical protein BK809_0001113 [Diplodia seriata]|uniref:Xylanolytic transcriptional activator regulatory domain-containing protein n=1 Tax=Diplodia seriata TaxID=420778 RepID=A0A1S8B5T3_9PEZI|nr:hypothetical protein BK809_0001113 [Diplodia seriata]
MPLESENVDVATSPHWPYSVDLTIQDRLSQQTRDRILQLVIQTVGSNVSIPSFPSAEFLDVLIKNGIAKKLETDAWIHPHTFSSQTTRTELLTALIAAGCVCFGIMSVGKTGGMLQEIVRVALNNLVESDNSVLRDLQYLQAYMTWLDIGIWCGYKRKMEIAESNLQPLCTVGYIHLFPLHTLTTIRQALRKAGVFNKSFYKRIVPLPSDDDATLEGKWRQWVEQESYKRLVYHLFEHDIEVAFTMSRNPLTSYAEFSVPFPAERDIWLAPSPSAWRAIHLSKARAPDPIYNSLKDMLMQPDRLNTLSGDADFTMSISIFVHGVGAMVWDYRKQASITQDSPSHDDATTQLWLQSRRQDLYHLLQTTQTDHHKRASPAILTLLSEFLQMYLHVSLDDVQRFAGKYGDDQARRACATFVERDWTGQRAARHAVWHAGQVLRAARAVPPYQLRGADAIAVYYAALTLWVYGVLRGHAAVGMEKEGAMHAENVDATIVRLDCAQGREQAGFLGHGVGTPVLSLGWDREDREAQGITQRQRHLSSNDSGGVVEIQPGQVMRVGAQVLEGNYPNSGRDELPPMIMSLRNLMRDLGRLP